MHVENNNKSTLWTRLLFLKSKKLKQSPVCKIYFLSWEFELKLFVIYLCAYINPDKVRRCLHHFFNIKGIIFKLQFILSDTLHLGGYYNLSGSLYFSNAFESVSRSIDEFILVIQPILCSLQCSRVRSLDSILFSN